MCCVDCYVVQCVACLGLLVLLGVGSFRCVLLRFVVFVLVCQLCWLGVCVGGVLLFLLRVVGLA